MYSHPAQQKNEKKNNSTINYAMYRYREIKEGIIVIEYKYILCHKYLYKYSSLL
jgi:hypothetical protein